MHRVPWNKGLLVPVKLFSLYLPYCVYTFGEGVGRIAYVVLLTCLFLLFFCVVRTWTIPALMRSWTPGPVCAYVPPPQPSLQKTQPPEGGGSEEVGPNGNPRERQTMQRSDGKGIHEDVR